MSDINNKAIEAQLEANKHGLDWAKSYLKTSQLANTREQLIKNRIDLKRIKRAANVKPAAAVFGESQVGKSYMADCLLTSESSVLNIYDGQGKATGFLEYINPLGGGKEATSLISRFTVDKVWINDEYPVRVEMLSPIDVVMVIIDTYFNDVKNHQFPDLNAIKAEIERLKTTYGPLAPAQDVITEDEIFELKEYFNLGRLERGEVFRVNLLDNGYFETLAQVIKNVEVSRWTEVFKFLWNDNPHITKVFGLLMKCLERLDFSRTVYIKMDAVLRTPGTILHVDRLYELFGIDSCTNDKGETVTIDKADVPDMVVMTDKGKVVNNVQKSEFCALAMEVDFTITPQDGEPGTVSDIEKEKPFLSYLDILDFPGARSRKMIEASNISETEACEMMLRGKVAYLFNKYSQQYLISNLLFCHHDLKSEVATLPSLLRGWVESTVGYTPSERAEFMSNTQVPPLFLIGTKFNIDLSKTPDDSKGDEVSKKKTKDYRWTKRFGNLLNLLGQSETNTWLSNWTPSQTFKNVYLLRSFEYSCQNGLTYGYQHKDETTGNWKLIYNEDGKLQGEQGITDEYKKFLPELKTSFLENEFVNKHFANPDKSWNEVLGYDQDGKWSPRDGSAWIIENLTKSSQNMKKIRELQIRRVMESNFNRLVQVLHSFYHDDNSDAELGKQLAVAGSIALTFDALFGTDKYFFSDFLSSLIIEEERLHDVVLDIINNTSVIEETDLSKLFAIRANANVNPEESYEENRRRLRETYSCATDDDLDRLLADFGIKVEDIINPPKVLNFSHLIADGIERVWVANYLNSDRFKEFIARGLKEELLTNFFSNLEALYTDKLKISERMAKRIHPYVSTSSGSVDDMSDMIADICSEMINKFIVSVGSEYYDDDTWEDISSAIDHNKFDVEIIPNDSADVTFDEDEVREGLPGVFSTFDNIDKILNKVKVDEDEVSHFSNYEVYRKWRDRMKMSFLATAGIPKYDVDMNNALRNVLADKIVKEESLAVLVENNPILKTLSTLN